ncbi:restriction endonuclease subunit S [Fulvivirga imtechensis]|nr:restriction endonuclease subunit S [Fulvivirga imtechensis]
MTKRTSQDCKHTKLGWIPAEWEYLEFGLFVQRSSTKYDPRTDEQQFPCIELEHIEQNTGRINGHINSKAQKSTKNKFSKGEVLFAKLRPYLRKYWLAEFDGVSSSEVWILRGVKGKCSSIFLFYLIQLHKFIELANRTSGTKMPRADWSLVSEYPFPLPPLPEQQKIAQILSTWDKAISKTEQLITKKQERKKGLMQQLLTGKKRFREFVKSDKMKETKLGVIPEDWEAKKLGELGIFLKGKGVPKAEIKKEGLPCLTYGELYTRHHNIIRSFSSYIPKEITLESQELEYGDILFAGSGETLEEIGKSAAFINSFKAYAGGDIIILRRHDQDPEYLGYLLNHNSINRQKHKLGQGHSVVHIYSSGLKALLIPLPDKKEQQKIASVLSEADTEIKILQKQLVHLKEQKKGLMQKLLTGEVRVKLSAQDFKKITG